MRQYVSVIRVSLGLLAGFGWAMPASPQVTPEVDELVPNAARYGDSEWYHSEWLGAFFARDAWLPWVYSANSGWWWARSDGWWYTLRQPPGIPVALDINLARIAAVRDIVDAALEDYDIPGIIYSIKFVGDEPWVDARGVRNLATGEPLGPNDHFRIGSASKTFVGMAALRLIHQKALSFETPISLYLDEDVLINYPKDQITIRMLLRHTSGINNYTNIIDDWFMPYINDRTRVWTNEELVALIDERHDEAPENGGKVFNPGAGWFYSNTNTVLLGMIIEGITGKSIGDYIQDEFLTPLGLAGTSYPEPGTSAMPEPYAHGYMNWANYTGEPSLPDELLDVSVYDPSGVGPAGPIVSTAADLATWMEVIVNNRQLIGDLRRGHIDWRYFISFNSSSPGESSGSYGMNLAHEPDLQNNANYFIIGHRGQISGYDTAMMYLPEKQCALVLVCTRSLKMAPGLPTNALEAALNAIIAELFPDLIAENQLPVRLQTYSASFTGSGRKTAPEFSAPLTEY